MTRREWHLKRIVDAFSEFRASEVAADLLDRELRADPSFLSRHGLRRRVAWNLRDNLEGTYLIRIFAEFEGGLRDVLQVAWKKLTEPPVRDLIDAFAARCVLRQDLIDEAHRLREARNALVHPNRIDVEAVSLDDAQRSLCEFFSRSPKDW